MFTNGAIEVEDEGGPPFKLNGQHLKLYFEVYQEISLLKKCTLKMLDSITMSCHKVKLETFLEATIVFEY